MNLRVDLILENEQRSGSLVSGKGAIRIVSVVLPVILLGYLTIQLLVVGQRRQDLVSTRASYDSAKPQQEKAKTLMAGFQAHRDIQAELDGWSRARLPWQTQIYGLLRHVPANIQLQELTLSQTLQLTNNLPARQFVLSLRGQATTAQAEPSVKSLETALSQAAPFAPYTSEVSVPVYGADTSATAGRDDRVFQIVCQYEPLVFQ